MSEVDPLVLKILADVNEYTSKVKSSTRLVDQQFGIQERRVARLEAQMRTSSAAIGASIKGIGASLAGFVTGRELVGLVDNFTRLQNSLKVAGLEGKNLAEVQEALFAAAQRNGVAINALADLYGKAAGAQKELGATQSQLVKLTDLTAQSLRITGTSTEAASGAILGLGQALAAGKVNAEDFNQINEGGLRPLLQAAAASEKFGGSVAKLREAVVGGKLSSQEFFNLVLKGASDIETRAAKATLTLAGGFNTLTNALTVYFGEADKANGVSAALGEALGALADNLDTIIPAIATVATALGVRYVVGATAAIGATVLASNALFALQARAAGAATSIEALSFAMQGAKGGVITAAVLALGAAFYYTYQQTVAAQEAGERYQKAGEQVASVTKRVADLTDKLTTAKGKERDAVLKSAQAFAEEARQKSVSAAWDVILAHNAYRRAKQRASEVQQLGEGNPMAAGAGDLGSMLGGNFGASASTQAGLRQAEADLKKAEANAAEAEKAYRDIRAMVASPPSATTGSPAASTGGKGTTSSGPSLNEINDRFQSERAQLAQQALSAQQSFARSAEERAELELRGVELARIRTAADIKNNKDYSKAQKAILLDQVERLAELEREGVEFEKRRQLEQESQQLADEQFRSQRDALQIQLDLADSQGERKRLALDILAAEQEHLRATLDAVIASKTATEADKKRAQLALDSLNALAPGDRERTARQNETDAEKYARGLNKSPEQINEALDAIKIEGLEALNDGLVDAIMGVKGLGNVFSDVAKSIIRDLIRIAIQQFIVKTLFQGLLGLGGGGLFGGLFGGGGGGSPAFNAAFAGFRASGGPVAAGKTYMVGERGPELLRMGGQSGYVIPNELMTADARRGAGIATVRLELSGDIDARIQRVSGPVAVQVVRASAPGIVSASSQLGASEAEGRILARGRRRIPG